MDAFEECPMCGDEGDKTLDETPWGDMLWVSKTVV